MFPFGNCPGPSNQMDSQQFYQSNIQFQPTMNNPAIPQQMQQFIPTQNVPTNYLNYFLPPMPQMSQPNNNYTNQEHNEHQLLRMTSTSEEEEEETQPNQENAWQVITSKSTKRRKTRNTKQTSSEQTVHTNNRFAALSNVTEVSHDKNSTTTTNTPKPPPIFIHGVIKYNEMVKKITDILEEEQYHTKSLANNVVKINCQTPDHYRKLVKEFKEQNIYHHTYQVKMREHLE